MCGYSETDSLFSEKLVQRYGVGELVVLVRKSDVENLCVPQMLRGPHVCTVMGSSGTADGSHTCVVDFCIVADDGMKRPSEYCKWGSN